jgi:predicted DNA-binding helix-hairpin-helix protein
LAPEKKLVTIRDTMSAIKTSVDEAQGQNYGASDSAICTRRARQVSKAARKFAPAGQNTQLVVGATETNNATILNLAADLYGKHHLRRIYYSAFSPFPKADSRLPLQAPPLVREHRLYQADWLRRSAQLATGGRLSKSRFLRVTDPH